MRPSKEPGAEHVLRLTGDRNQDDGYDVLVELWHPSTSVARKTKAYCDYCNIERMAEVAGRTAIEMLASADAEADADEDAIKKQTAETSPSPQVSPSDPRPSHKPAPMLVTPPADPHASDGWLPWTFIGVGAVAAGYGAWALYEHGRATGTCSPALTTTCDHYDSKTIGIVALTGGGLLAATGVIWQIARLSRHPDIALSPNAVFLTTRF